MTIWFAVWFSITLLEAQRLARFDFGYLELVLGSGRDLRLPVDDRLVALQEELTLNPSFGLEFQLL